MHPRFLSLSSTDSTFGSCNLGDTITRTDKSSGKKNEKWVERGRDPHIAGALLEETRQDHPRLRVLPQPAKKKIQSTKQSENSTEIPPGSERAGARTYRPAT